MRVLLVQDDRRIGDALSASLSAQGHRPVRCESSVEALMANLDTDLVLLDVGRSRLDTDGLRVLLKLWLSGDIPVLVLSANSPAKRGIAERPTEPPCEPERSRTVSSPLRELLTVANSITRDAMRYRGEIARPGVKIDDVVVDLQARTVRVAGRYLPLTLTEFEILHVLARHAGVAVNRKHIIEEVWSDCTVGASRALNTHMSALRAKLDRPHLLRTIRGFGYRFG